nr:ATP synthase subunit 8 [Austromenopon atrofulvum]
MPQMFPCSCLTLSLCVFVMFFVVSVKLMFSPYFKLKQKNSSSLSSFRYNIVW